MSTPTPSSLTWTQAPTRHLLRLSWPICMSTISWAVYTIVDTWFVSHLGTEALAAASLGGVLCFSTIWFSRGILTSVKLKISQERGANPQSDPDPWLASGLHLALWLGAGGVLSLFALAGLAGFLTETEGAGIAARDYILLRGSGIFFCLFGACLREALFGQSESKIPLWGSLAGTLSNVLLDALFIFKFNWGVQGAAFATGIAYGIDFLVLYILDAQRREKLGAPAMRWHWIWRKGPGSMSTLWTLGWPIGIANFLEIGAFAVLTAIVARVGNRDLAAHQIALQTLHFAFLPVLAIGEGASIMVSEALGAQARRWFLPIAGRALLIVTGFSSLMVLVLVYWSPQIAQHFGQEPELISLVVSIFYVAAFFQVSDGFNIVARCVLRGMQDIRFVSTTTISLTWGITCPLAYALALHQGYGAIGAWWAISIEVSLVAVILWIRLLRKARRRPQASASREEPKTQRRPD